MDGNQDNQEQQGQQKSSVDRANDLINKAQSVRKNYKRGKATLNAIKAARAGATVLQGAAATSPAWGTAAGIILLILLVIVLFIVVFGGGDLAQSGTEGGNVDYECTGTCQATACSGTDIPDTNATCSANPADICCIPKPPPGVQPPIKFYCQYDRTWTTGFCNTVKYGCAPTSMAMIMSSYGDTSLNPLSVALANNRVGGCYDGTNATELRTQFFPWMRGLGYTIGPNLASGTSFNTALAKTYIDNGYILLAGANITFRSGGTLKRGGHEIVISNIDAFNNVTAYDPTFCRSDTSYTTRSFNVFDFGNTLSCPNRSECYWYHVYPIKKQ